MLLLQPVPAYRPIISNAHTNHVPRGFAGDEFVLILPDIKDKKKNAVTIIKRILASFSVPFTLDGHEIFASASIGISFYPTDGDDAETLVKNADKAMYRAKKKGKNKYAIFSG